MKSKLTGDFAAVVQISQGTVNRLLASAHQNAFVDAGHPSFPHSVVTDIAVGGTVGRVWAQVGSPRITLLDRATDRFQLDVSVRAQFEAGSGSDPLPRHIAGTISAIYRMEPVDPSCPGWQRAAADHVWLRVEPDSVTFEGTAVDDVGFIVTTPSDPAVVRSRIATVARHLLEHQFAATPHRVMTGFDPGSMIMLHDQPGRAAVALPVSLTKAPPKGKVSSIKRYLLDGIRGHRYDVALGIGADSLVKRVRSVVDGMVGTELDEVGVDASAKVIGFEVVGFHARWQPAIASANVSWEGPSPFAADHSVGVVKVALGIDVHALSVETVDVGPKESYNFDLVVTQYFDVVFNRLNHSIELEPALGPLVNYFGPFGAMAQLFAGETVRRSVTRQISNLTGSLPRLDLSPATDRLEGQLRTLDPRVWVVLRQAEFSTDGVVIRGEIEVSRRDAPVVRMRRWDDLSGFDAFEAWIPGGHIDRLRWSWSWHDGVRPDGDETRDDRFTFERPFDGVRSEFGIWTRMGKPLPGLDGDGSVCVDIEGVTTSPKTGELVPVSGHVCDGWGTWVISGEDLGFSIPKYHDPGPDITDPPPPLDQVVVEVARPEGFGAGANVLAVRLGSAEWEPALGESLQRGLEGCSRSGVGLVVVVVVPDRHPAHAALAREVYGALSDLPARLVVTEDVGGSWSRTCGFAPDERTAWALLTPTGGLSWAAQGALGAEDLAMVLDGHLFPAPPPTPQPLVIGPAVGFPVSPWVLVDAEFVELVGRRCPPPPVGRGNPARLVFARAGTEAETIDRIVRGAPADSDAQMTGIVLRGADEETAQHLARDLGDEVLVIADPSGAVTRRFGVGAWPTTIDLAADGRVAQVMSPLRRGHHPVSAPEASAERTEQS